LIEHITNVYAPTIKQKTSEYTWYRKKENKGEKNIQTLVQKNYSTIIL